MVDDIASAFKEIAKNAEVPEKKPMEWKHLAFLTVGMVVGLVIGYQLNLENSAQAMAHGICATYQANLGIMVENFNILAKNCSEAQTFRDVSILPALGANETIRIYTN